MKKHSINKILDTLEKKIDKKDIELMRVARYTVDNINSDDSTIQKALKSVELLGHYDYLHFLELLSLNHFNICISDKYLNKIN